MTSGPINLLEADSNAKMLVEVLRRTDSISWDVTLEAEVKDTQFELFKDFKQVEKDVKMVGKDRIYFAEFLPLRLE